MNRRVPYTPPKCTVCQGMATYFADNNEPRCTRHQKDKPRTIVCDKCKSLMVPRMNKRNKSYFWGCTGYPKCMSARSM